MLSPVILYLMILIEGVLHVVAVGKQDRACLLKLEGCESTNNSRPRTSSSGRPRRRGGSGSDRMSSWSEGWRWPRCPGAGTSSWWTGWRTPTAPSTTRREDWRAWRRRTRKLARWPSPFKDSSHRCSPERALRTTRWTASIYSIPSPSTLWAQVTKAYKCIGNGLRTSKSTFGGMLYTLLPGLARGSQGAVVGIPEYMLQVNWKWI